MKSSRRIDADNVRRDSRDREVSHTSGGSRFGRKRPSMLSEFHGNKHVYSHNAREGERESLQHYRSHGRYSHDTSGGGASSIDHTHTASGFHSKSKADSRSRHSRHHSQNRSTSHHHSNSHHHTNDATVEEDLPVKRPRLIGDISRKSSGHSTTDTPNNSTDTMTHSTGGQNSTSNPPWTSGGLLTYHLEDIDSDDDSLLQEEYDKKLSKSPTPIPTDSPAPSSPLAASSPPKPAPQGGGMVGSSPMPSKEELLMMMEKVDRDIAAAESQISALEKKRTELQDTSRTAASTPHSSTLSSLPSPTTPGTPLDQVSVITASLMEEDTPLPSPSPSTRFSPKKSQMDIIYSDNRMKSRSAHSALSSISLSPLPSLTALYHQPCETPLYYHNLLSHQTFRPKLTKHLRKWKLDKHKKDLRLCEEYDSQMLKWETSVERIETNPKKKARDQKNRELFERYFPELKAKREHQERMTRVDQRGYPIVRSDAELKEIMYELCEQEEGPVRYRKTHAVVPPMVTGDREKKVKFYNNNGVISDPMALHRDSRFIGVWSEEERSIFRDKYMFYPKNFEVIASFLPNKSPSDCVQYYYLTKKRENFKHLVRKANLKRKKPFVKPSDYSNPQLTLGTIPPLPLSLFSSAKPKTEDHDPVSPDEESAPLPPEFGDWSSEEISCLKDGLRKYGRAWGKIYREVGGVKTATQCKQFYDKHCGNQELDLSASLSEHSTMKNAEKLRRKVENHKPSSTDGGKRKSLKPAGNKPSPLQGAEEIDSENTASAYESDSNSEESTSESTITDSSPEDGSSNSAFVASTQQKVSQRGKKPKSLSSGFRRTSEEALDLFISAAEALNNIIPPDVALHDHSYSLPPNSLMNNVDLQATSGLSLIAAAAAVVSPTLSKNAASNKLPSLSPVRAPRGRPPNSQRKGTNGTSSKLAPTLLSPAGTSPSVLLTEMKAAPLRGRTRSAPADRPKLATFHVPRTGSTLARMSINSNSRTVGRAGGTSGGGLLSSYSRHKGDSSSGKTLKSMIAFHPTTSTTCSSGSATSTNATSAFEALVNVAVAAPPAELPMSASSPHTSYSKSSPVATTAFTATPLTRSSQSSKDTLTIGVAGSNSNASNSGGTTTAFIDVNQAINILASLAQHQVSSSAANGSSQSIVLPNSRLFAPNQTVNLLGNIVSGGSKGGSATGLTLPTSKGSKSLSVSATVDTLLGHLTSGIGAQASTTKSTAGKASGGSGRLKKTAGSKSEGAGVKSSSGNRGSGTKLVTNTTLPVQLIGSMDELSNLNLLSSLVAAVAASQATVTSTSSQQTTPTSEPTVTSDQKSSVGQPSNLHSSSNTEVKRAALSRTSSSESTYQGHNTPTPLIAASSSIKKSSLQSSSSGGVYDGGASNELPRSVVRTGLGTMATAEGAVGEEGVVANTGNSIPQSSENDMTASLASIIPSYNPSMNSQSSLLLYTRSLSFPLSVPPETSAEEEDHLESATRGISELSKLLGTDSNTENSSSPNTKHNRSVYKGLSNWNPADLLSSSAPSKNTPCGGDFAGGLVADKAGKPYLSGLLESQVHGTVHTSSKLNNSSTNSAAGRVEGLETTLDMDHSR